MTRQEAVEYIQEWLKDEYALNGKDRVVLDMAIEALEQEPIIRCKDCKYAKPFLDRYHCKQLDEDWEINFGAEHYCSFAEPKGSDEE